MKKVIFGACLFLLATPLLSKAQQGAYGRQAENLAYNYFNTNAAPFYSDAYKPEKKYIVVKLWHESEPLTEIEKKELSRLKEQLLRKNIGVIDYQWKSKEDLVAFFKQYNVSVDVFIEDALKLKGENVQMSTTSKKVLLVFEESKPLSLCSGENCELNTKYFFKLITSS